MNYSTSSYNHTTGTSTVNIAGSLTNNGVYSTSTGTAAINIAGSWINNLTFTTSSTNTVTFNGSSNQTIGGTAATTFNNLIINPSAGITVSPVLNNISIVNNLTVSTGIFDLSTFTCNRTSAGGSFSLAAGTLLKVEGSNNFPQTFTNTLDANSTVEYYGTIAQSVYPATYGYLTLSNNSIKTATGNINIAANLNINSSAIFAGSTFTHSIAGNWYNNVSSTAYTAGSSTFTFNGSAGQTIGGTAGTTFNNLIINDAGGVNFVQDQTVNTALTLTAGNVIIGTNNFIFGSAASAVAGSPFSASNMIIADGGGEVRKNYSTPGSFLFPIGDNTGTAEYSPITLNYTSGTFAGGAYAGVTVTDAKHPNNASTTDYLTRYWTTSNSGITSSSFTATANYLAADIAGTETNIAEAKYSGGLPWIKYGVIGSNILTCTAISNTGTGIVFTGITTRNPNVSISGGGVSICNGGSVSLGSTVTNNGTSSISYAWTPTGTLSSSTISNPTATPTITTIYSLIVTDGNGITSTPATTTITVNARPTGALSGSATICNGGSTNLTITATGTGTITGTLSDGTAFSGTAPTITVSVTPSSTITYTIATLTNGTCASIIADRTGSATVTVNARPTGALSGSATICNGGSTNLIITATGTGTITGTLSDGTAFSGTAPTITVSVSPSSTITYTIATLTNGTCASIGADRTGSATVTVNARPTGVLSGTATICNGGSTSLTITATGTGTITGTLSNGTAFSGTTPTITVSVNPSSTITYTIATLTNGTCASISADRTGSATVTVNTPPSATISYSGSPFCSNTGIATITFSGTTGGTYSSSPAGVSINSVTGIVDLALSAPGRYTITYTVASSGGCATYTTTTVIIINPNTWTGGISTDWNTPGNWAANAVPAITCPDVTILSGVPYQPVLSSGTFAIQNLFINTGANLIVENATLQISGTINNSGIFNASNGTIEMNGAAAQTIPANAFQNNAINNLIVSNSSSGGVTLGGAMDVYGSLTYSGTGMKLTTNDALTLKSTALNTAWIGDMTGNTITGKVTVERYISAHKAWRFLSVPTNTTQTVKQTWQEGATSNGSNPVGGYGTQITSNRAGLLMDLICSLQGPSMKTYNSATNSWAGIANTNTASIKATNGYMVFIRGDRTANAFNSTPTQTVLRTKGSLYTGDQAPIPVSAGKFAAIGNPYASALDMRSITKTGLKDFFYVWDPKLGGSSGLGAYQTFSND